MTSEDFFEIANAHFYDALPFVLYRKPKTDIIKGLFQEDNTVYTSKNLTESGFVFAPFETNRGAVIIPLNNSKAYTLAWNKQDDSVFNNRKTHEKDTLFEAKQNHINNVEKAIETIKNGHLQKVVLSRRETISLSESNPIKLFKRLLKTYQTAFVYCWYHPKIGLWLGATPESLLSLVGNRFSTMALAGTQKFNQKDNPNWEEKETEEQELVTRFIVKSLHSLADNISVGTKETVRAGNLLHLRTLISGTFKSSVKSIVDALHPTPAVCGLPKINARQFILDNENYEREYYTGYLGELNIKEKTNRNTNRRNFENSVYTSIKTVSNLYVNLRCMQLTDVKANIYIGGGITKDSIPKKEWEETVSKTQTMKRILI